MATDCSFCDEPRISRCSYADCPWEVDDAKNTIARLTAELTALRTKLETVEADRAAQAERIRELEEALRPFAKEAKRLGVGSQADRWKALGEAGHYIGEEAFLCARATLGGNADG